MIKAYAKSDVGRARELNEDSFYITEDQFSDIQLFILADGMGGCNAGEVASSEAINCAKKYIENNFANTPKNKESLLNLIRSSIEYANMIVYENSLKNKNLEGMGTTLEVCLIYNNRAYIGHIGDSRIYRIRNNFMRKLTQDHSYVQKLVQEGTITKEEAEHHEKKNILMKALGCNAYAEADVMVKGFQKGDILIICSDGLTNMVNNEDIYKAVNGNFEFATRELIDLANQNGGIDNITIITIRNL